MKMDIQSNALNLDTAYSIKYKYKQNYQMDIYIFLSKNTFLRNEGFLFFVCGFFN